MKFIWCPFRDLTSNFSTKAETSPSTSIPLGWVVQGSTFWVKKTDSTHQRDLVFIWL